MNISWLLWGGGPFFGEWQVVVDIFWLVLDSGGWWWTCFGQSWVVVGGGGYALVGGEQWWVVVGHGGSWWVVVQFSLAPFLSVVHSTWNKTVL